MVNARVCRETANVPAAILDGTAPIVVMIMMMMLIATRLIMEKTVRTLWLARTEFAGQVRAQEKPVTANATRATLDGKGRTATK